MMDSKLFWGEVYLFLFLYSPLTTCVLYGPVVQSKRFYKSSGKLANKRTIHLSVFLNEKDQNTNNIPIYISSSFSSLCEGFFCQHQNILWKIGVEFVAEPMTENLSDFEKSKGKS